MKRFVASVAFGVSIAAAATGAMSNASAAMVFNQMFPVSGVVIDPCGGDAWSFTADLHLMMTTTTTPSGGTLIDMHDNVPDVKVVDLSTGATGVGNEADNATINVPAGASEVTMNGQTHLVTQGSAQNFVLTYVMHLTLTPDGVVTANVSDFEIRCLG